MSATSCGIRSVGDFVWHPQHGHWHFADYALYELRALLPDGTADMSEAGLVSGGGKVSFCLMDTRRHTTQPVEQDPFVAGFYVGCTGVVQGISPGWSDTYGFALASQQIDVDAVPLGSYALVVTIDPDDRLIETDHTDNVSVQSLELYEENGALKVRAL